jgi:hypothetical protein
MGADLLVSLFHIGKGLNRLSFLCLDYPGKYYPGCGLIQFFFLISGLVPYKYPAAVGNTGVWSEKAGLKTAHILPLNFIRLQNG